MNFEKIIAIVTKILTMTAAAVILIIMMCISDKQLIQEKGAIPVLPETADSVNTNIKNAVKDTMNAYSNKTVLTPASDLIIKACDNYLEINSSGSKSADVLNIKASVLYNNRQFDECRKIYGEIVAHYADAPVYDEAIRMIAQAYYEEKRFDEAQEWYRKLSSVAKSGEDKIQAVNKIAESIYRMAEAFEERGQLKDAAEQYERVALEFPDTKIAEIALFNGGLVQEKLALWSKAVIAFQKIIQKYPNSTLLAKSYFRIAKNYEKMLQWDFAAETYLNVTMKFPQSELASVSLYNAGFCFENAGKVKEGAAVFEKMAYLYSDAPDAPDVLFKAGEMYGHLKDWESVSRVNQIFAQKFGNDEDRVVQALCMNGIALYMQNYENEAVVQLEKAVATFGKIKSSSTVNLFYAAKAMYTIGEIYHAQMSRITLNSQKGIYKKQLAQKSELLDKTLSAYTRVIKINVSEWTTRTICQIGQLYEDFAIGIFKQQRDPSLSFEDQFALELGIAQAVEQLFVEKSLHYHEQNVKLGIKENINDKYVQMSKQKLTYLPYVAAENYRTLVDITKKADEKQSLQGFAGIARTLQTLQKIAPFQEKAIELHLKCIELGTTYQQQDDFYSKAASSITGTSFVVGETYANVVAIARNAPLPDNFNDYERFVYKTKLLKQVESYEEQALTNYLKTVKIAEAYKITDKNVNEARYHIARLLFNKARCYDILCSIAFTEPPYPNLKNEAQIEDYKSRFEEIGLKFQDQAFEIYRSILDLASQNYAGGDFVSYAYIRLYQNFPDQYGVSEEVNFKEIVSADTLWNCSVDSVSFWTDIDFQDSAWKKCNWIKKEKIDKNKFPDSTVNLIWYAENNSGTAISTLPKKVFFRRFMNITELPQDAAFQIYLKGYARIFINGEFIGADSSNGKNFNKNTINLLGKIRRGANIIAIEATSLNDSVAGIGPFLTVSCIKTVKLPKPPGAEKSLSLEDVGVDKFQFPAINNFSLKKGNVQ